MFRCSGLPGFSLITPCVITFCPKQRAKICPAMATYVLPHTLARMFARFAPMSRSFALLV